MFFTGMTFVANQLKRNIKTLDQRAQRLMVANNGSYFHVQTAVVCFHQQVAQTVCFFGHQDHDAASTGWGQFAHGTFRKRAVEIGKQGGVVENTFEFGTHKEAAGTVVNELVVLHDIQFMFVANVGNSCDQSFLIGTDGAQNFTL